MVRLYSTRCGGQYSDVWFVPHGQTVDGTRLDRLRPGNTRARGIPCTQGGRPGAQARRLARQLLLALRGPAWFSWPGDRALAADGDGSDHCRPRAVSFARTAP